jgi:transmembrane sensor
VACRQFTVTMSIQKELIHLLALEELAGVISEDDQAYLSLIIRENSEAFEVWQETRAVLDTPDVKEFLSRPRSAADIFLLPTIPKLPNMWRMFSLSATALLLSNHFLLFLFR